MPETSKPRALPSGKGGLEKVVKLLAKFVRHESKLVGNKTRNLLVYKCPSEGCNLRDNEIVFPDKTGFTNPFKHLKMCVAQNDLKHLADYYWTKADAKESGSLVTAHFSVLRKNVVPEESRDIFNWIRLIVQNSLPINIVEDSSFRDFHGSDKKHSGVKIKQIMFKLCEYVEKLLAEEMASAGRGTLMHDGWSKFGTHFLALMGIYVVKKKVKFGSNSKDSFVEETKIVLLSVSPVLRPELPDIVDYDNDDPNPVLVTNNAEAMLHHVIGILKEYYNVDWSWVMAIHSDRAAVCIKMAKEGKKPMIGCKNHAWDHDVTEMFRSNDGLSSCQEACHACQVGLKQSVKKRTLLGEFTPLQPTIKNETRWNGMYSCMKKQERMTPSLQLLNTSGRVYEEFDQPDSMFNPLVLQPVFRTSLTDFNKDLKDIHKATSTVQTRLMPFNVTNMCMNLTTNTVNNSNNSDIVIERVHSGQNSTKRLSPHFENGIFKIQEGKKADLSEDEREACRHVLLNTVDDNTVPDPDNMGDYLESLKKKPRLEDSDYGNVSIFLGSCAEVERVWSIASYVLTNTQANMTPALFETVLFLKYNWSFVTLAMVQRAIADVRTENFNTRQSEADQGQEQEQAENN